MRDQRDLNWRMLIIRVTTLDLVWTKARKDLGQLVEILVQGPNEVKKPNKSETHDLGHKWKWI